MKAEGRAQDLHGLAGAGHGARDIGEILHMGRERLEAAPRLLGLDAADVVERNVLLPLEPPSRFQSVSPWRMK